MAQDMIFNQSLYGKDSKGNIREWNIQAVWDHGDIRIDREYGLVSGEKQLMADYVEEGKASRDIEEQALLQINSMIKKKMDAGYVSKMEDAKNNQRVNQLGLPRPMLAKPYKDAVKNIDYESESIYVQRKYNGLRCLVANILGEKIAYSRNGIKMNYIPHIFNELNIPEGWILDGELYHHGTKLQRINSWVKKDQPETKQLTYIIYDVIPDSEISYERRLNFLEKNYIEMQVKHSQVAQTALTSSEEQTYAFLTLFLRQGFEGVILRRGCGLYQPNKRPNDLIKLKKVMDDEFLIVGMEPSKEGYAIFICADDKGRQFKVTAHGSMPKKHRFWLERKSIVGKFLNVEFAELTERGVPFHPVATGFREKTSE